MTQKGARKVHVTMRLLLNGIISLVPKDSLLSVKKEVRQLKRLLTKHHAARRSTIKNAKKNEKMEEEPLPKIVEVDSEWDHRSSNDEAQTTPEQQNSHGSSNDENQTATEQNELVEAAQNPEGCDEVQREQEGMNMQLLGGMVHFSEDHNCPASRVISAKVQGCRSDQKELNAFLNFVSEHAQTDAASDSISEAGTEQLNAACADTPSGRPNEDENGTPPANELEGLDTSKLDQSVTESKTQGEPLGTDSQFYEKKRFPQPIRVQPISGQDVQSLHDSELAQGKSTTESDLPGTNSQYPEYQASAGPPFQPCSGHVSGTAASPWHVYGGMFSWPPMFPAPPVHFANNYTTNMYDSSNLCDTTYNGGAKPQECQPRTGGQNSKANKCRKVEKEEITSTTVRLANVPNNMKRKHLRRALDEFENGMFCGTYDFLYLAFDWIKGDNLGYAFINFFTLEDAKQFQAKFEGHKLKPETSKKKCHVGNADAQGLGACLHKFKGEKGESSHPVHKQPRRQRPIQWARDSWRLLDGDSDIGEA